MTTATVQTNATKEILIIEDDALIADVYREKLRTEGFAVAVAGDGQSGLARFKSHKPDLVLLDLMLPQVSGVDVLRSIRARFSPRELPVLVFTNAYLGGAVQQAWEAGANQVLTKATFSSKLLIGMIKNALETPPLSAVPPTTASPTTEVKIPCDLESRKKFLAAAPETLAALWQPLKSLAAKPANLEPLEDLQEKIHTLIPPAKLAGLYSIVHISVALEGLIKELREKARRLTPSVLLTLAQAIDTLKLLLNHPECAPKDPAAAKILVVDDDEITRRSVCRALARVNLKATCLDNPVSALKRRVGTRFDLIFLDIEMPEATGFDLCTRLRTMPAYANTPIVFLSIHNSFDKRTESVLRGGNDYLTKPFLFTELAVKALSFVLRGPLKATATGRSSNGKDIGMVFSRRDLNALKQSILGGFDQF